MSLICPKSDQGTPSQTPTPTPTPRSPKFLFQKENVIKHFCKVNPSILIEWEGKSKKNDEISGSGILTVYERAKDLTKKGNLIFSIQADQWVQNRPVGNITMISIHYFENKGPKGIIKEVRKYEGGSQELVKHGYGEYTIEHHFANQTRDVCCIKGEWFNDFIKLATVVKNGKEKTNVNMEHNIQMDNQRLTLTRKTLEPLQLTKQKLEQSSEFSNSREYSRRGTKKQSGLLELPKKLY